MMLMTCLVTQRITDKSVSEFNYWRRFLAVLGYNPAIIESSPQNFPGSMEYFLGSLWCGCGEWRVMAVSGVYRGQRAERQECGSWRSEFDWFHHPAAGHSHQGIRADRASEMRWCSLMHFKSYSQIKCDYILQDILLLSLAKVQCPRVKSFHINSCLQCSFIYPNIDVWYLQKIYCETKSDRIFWHLTSL